MTQPFTFIAESHTYLVGERVIPSVTQVLNEVGLVCYDHVPQAILEHKAEIGTAAHQACWFFDQNDLDWETVDGEVEPYVRAWERFRQESDFAPELIEHRGIGVANGMQYGYTLDRTGILAGRDVLLEIKCTAQVEDSWGPQLAAYQLARESDGDVLRHRIAVHLKPNGRYALIPYDDNFGDRQVFKMALALVMWKRNRHGQRSTRKEAA